MFDLERPLDEDRDAYVMTNRESTSTEKRTQRSEDLETIQPSKLWLLLPIVLILGAIFLAR